MRHPLSLCRYLALLALWLAGGGALATDASKGGNPVMGCTVTLAVRANGAKAPARWSSWPGAFWPEMAIPRPSAACPL